LTGDHPQQLGRGERGPVHARGRFDAVAVVDPEGHPVGLLTGVELVALLCGDTPHRGEVNIMLLARKRNGWPCRT
jgi:hypothetical protein